MNDPNKIFVKWAKYINYMQYALFSRKGRLKF